MRYTDNKKKTIKKIVKENVLVETCNVLSESTHNIQYFTKLPAERKEGKCIKIICTDKRGEKLWWSQICCR